MNGFAVGAASVAAIVFVAAVVREERALREANRLQTQDRASRRAALRANRAAAALCGVRTDDAGIQQYDDESGLGI